MPAYDPKKHVVTLGTIVLNKSSMGSDEWITVTRESAAWEDDVGVDGEVTRSKINDDRATATLTLMQSSMTNNELTAHYNADRHTPGGVPALPFTLTDLNGTTKLFAAEAWIQKSPDQARARKVGEVKWEIRLANIKEEHGGNL